MSEGRGLTRKVGRAMLWPFAPLIFAFRPGYRATREAMQLLREVPAIVPAETIARTVEEDSGRNLSALTGIRSRTRRYGRLFAVLLLADMAWWLWTVAMGRGPVFSAKSIELLAIAAVLASQFLVYAYGNWQARTGTTGTFLGFISDGRDLWPR